MSDSSSPLAHPLTIIGYSFILSADNHHQNGEKRTFLNVEYSYKNGTHLAQIPMDKDEFAEIREDLNSSSRLIEALRARH